MNYRTLTIGNLYEAMEADKKIYRGNPPEYYVRNAHLCVDIDGECKEVQTLYDNDNGRGKVYVF